MNRAPDLGERLLYQEALSLTERAYAPYSGFAVGAVVVGPSGRSHHGVNVENASYPAGLCAERAALAALGAFGERKLRYVAVAASGGRDCLPCGLCLQALAEFGDPEIVASVSGEVRVVRLRVDRTRRHADTGTEVAAVTLAVSWETVPARSAVAFVIVGAVKPVPGTAAVKMISGPFLDRVMPTAV